MAAYHTLIGGTKMPSVGLGTLRVSAEQIETALNAALEAGYRHIDTAWIYQNEAFIGDVLKKWLSSGKLKREELFIVTKLPAHGVHPDRVEMFMKKSLKNLQLDYVDLYLIHMPICVKYEEGAPLMQDWDPEPTDHIAVWKKMEDQVDAGRAKTIGISNFNQKQIQRILDNSRIKPVNLQVELTPYFQQKELVAFCRKNGIVVVGYSSFGNPGNPKSVLRIKGHETTNLLSDETIKKIADKHKKTTAQILVRYFVEKNIVMIPKSVTPSRIKQNIDVYNFSLTKEDLKAMEDLDEGEDGRGSDVSQLFPKLRNHPECPYRNSIMEKVNSTTTKKRRVV